jgi:hypothetical protein
MGCVHTHQGRHVIEGCENLSHIQNIVENLGKIKVGKINQVINQTHTPRLEHDKI